MRKCGIYLITSPTGRRYVGSSVNLQKRFNEYRNLNCKTQGLIYRSLKKYGYAAHKLVVILVCERDDRLKYERLLGDYYSSMSVFGGLNLSLPGYGEIPQIQSEETKDKVRKFQTGRKRSEESIRKSVLANTGTKRDPSVGRKISLANKGRPVSPEHREKLRLATTGKRRSQEARDKIRARRLGKITSEETKKKLSKANMGIVRSMETRKKMSDAKKGVKRPYMSELNKQRQSKKIIDTKTGQVFESNNEAAAFHNLNICTLSNWLRGKFKNKTNLKYLTA